jgi:Ni/Co efflux regulator RcnB
MRRLFIASIALAAAMACTASAVFAQSQGRGRGHANADKGRRADDAAAFDRDGHVRAIREYARGGSLPPGLAKREALPPGLRTQLHERGELPPGLRKRLIPVPAPLLARLPPVPRDYHRYFAGDDLIVINTRTNRIIAIVPNVWR